MSTPSVLWIAPVFDRVLADCVYGNPKGCLDATVLNRIENNVQYLKELFDMFNIHYIKDISTNTSWARTMYLRITQLNRIKSNLIQLRASSVISKDSPTITLDVAEQPQLWNIVNDMEKLLYDIAKAFVRLLDDSLWCGECYCGGTKDEQLYEGTETTGANGASVMTDLLFITESGRQFII